MVAPKGAELLIRAWAQLRGFPQLTVIGDGPGMAAVTKLVSELRANVVLAGALGRPEILRELERAHLLVAPSMLEDGVSFEGVPTVLAEGMWAGIPVVASRVGGVERLFAADQPGWLVEPGDEQGLVDVLTAAMNPVAYSRAAHAARRVFDHLLAPGSVLDRYEVAYDRALAAWA
jgi:glycosyltransferase involved in cell wall biosynthesis